MLTTSAPSAANLTQTLLAWCAAILTLAASAGAQPPATPDNIGHDRHAHPHNPKHPTEAPGSRFTTSRKSDIALPLPNEQDAFTFVVFGDRAGGPVDGVKVLADAVHDANLLEPDLVMTVGDLVNGYNDTPLWLEQVREFKGIMDHLLCPWFPVAGNHDIYWRGKGAKPAGEHERDFEAHFGPLWYAFEHKNCWFIVLFSDEGNPVTGEKEIGKPDTQRMSGEQLNWLKETLAKAKGAEHVFLFLHHPRWLRGGYGDDWDKVHKELVAAGNVTAVFAGHIHHMRSDPRDGIEYITLATVGGHQDAIVSDAGYLHQYHVVTVRKNQVAMAAFPVGAAIDVKELSGELMDQCVKQAKNKAAISGPLVLGADGAVNQRITVTVPNLTAREMELTFEPTSADARWVFSPDHIHAKLKAGESRMIELQVLRPAGCADPFLRTAEVEINADVLMPGHRYALPVQHAELPLEVSSLPPPDVSRIEQALKLGGGDAFAFDPAEVEIPDGPFTVECWLKADVFGDRTGLICKTEQSDYGLFVSNGKPSFSVFLGKAYATATSDRSQLVPGKWQHIAGVFDGSEVRVYVDGQVVARVPGAGARKTNRLPLIVGADVTSGGAADSNFSGKIDALRISRSARYTDAFSPKRRVEADADTVLLCNFERLIGRQLWVERKDGKVGLAGRPIGAPVLIPAD